MKDSFWIFFCPPKFRAGFRNQTRTRFWRENYLFPLVFLQTSRTNAVRELIHEPYHALFMNAVALAPAIIFTLACKHGPALGALFHLFPVYFHCSRIILTHFIFPPIGGFIFDTLILAFSIFSKLAYNLSSTRLPMCSRR